MNITYREAGKGDAPLIVEFIRAIADYEKLSDEVKVTDADIDRWVFEENLVNVILAQVDGKDVGFALYFYNFSTFTGQPGLYLEDLFVYPEWRGHGLGLGLLKQLDAKAVEKGCKRMEWVCLDWNTPSIGFYRGLGARPMDEWTLYRIAPGKISK